MPLRVSTVQTGLEESIRKAVKNVNARGGLNIAINDKQFTRPLGKITGSVSEFNKSLEASNARVLAFGASVGIIQSVQRAFASLITTTIGVEKQLTEINVVMGTTNDQLQKFGDGLFKVARNTAQSFSTVATAATELARQGLSMEETLKRTNDALILTRLTGLDAASAVSGLTAALNTFNKAGLDSTKVLSKMAAVDVQFAVSTEDLIDAVSRAGAVARDAGVSFDELLGAVTAAQQQTARGGKVIGNSFKTIFTRVQRSSTIKRLEELGIAVRDIAGNTLPAIKILTNLSQTYETLADTTKAAVAEQVGGVFQINILKAAIKDLADNNSILARATRISAQATDEAIRKNEILNKTLAAVSSQAAVSIQEFTNAVGSIAFEDNLQTLITAFNDFFKSSADFLRNGEGLGADAARGFIKGFGNIITGPGLILALGVLGKLLLKTFGFLAGSVKELIGIKSLTQQQRDIQKSIVAVLGENEALQKKILSQEGNRAAQEKTILGILQAQSREQAKIASAASAIGPAVMRAGYNAQFKRTRSGGHIPNYVSSSDAKAERSGARMGGYSPGSVKSMNMPGQGKVVYNSAETVRSFPGMIQPAIMPPPRSRAGKNYQKAFSKVHGFNPYASGGFVPNFAGMRLNASSIKSIGKAKIRSQNYDGIIGMSELDKILTTGLFKSIKYGSKAGNELTYTNARWGVNKYKKGAPPPGDYVSYGQMDKATGTRALFVGSAGQGADAYRRLRLENVRSVVSQGKHLRVDPTLAQYGFIPNFALANTPFGVPYSTGLAGASPMRFSDNVIAKYESYKNPAKLNELLKSPAFTLDALKYLDNQGLEKIKQSMLSSGMLGSADWEFVKSGIGKPTTANVSKALKQVPARELFNYLTGQTDRIQGTIGGNFIRLLDHKERSAVAMDMIGRSSISGVIKNQISSIRKSKNRMNSAQMEALIRDVPRLGYDPDRGITRAKPGDYLRAQQYAPGGIIDQMAAISRGAMQSSSSSLRSAFPALGRKVDIQRIAGYMDEFGVDSGKAARALGIRDSRAEQAFKAVFGRRRSSGFIPNFAMRQRSTIKTTEMGGYGGAPNQVEFVSSVGGQPFTKSMAIVIPDPKNSTKPGLQVINTLDANPSLRGQGYGRELYEYMAGYAKKKGYAALYGDAGTSPSAMRVVDSIAKKGSFKVEKNSDLKFFKDDFDTTGMYASDSWTYRMSNKGFVPNYALFSPGAKNVLSTNPQYAGAVASAVSREAAFGFTPKVVSAPSLRSRSNPGLAVVNQEQEGGKLSNARRLHGGLNPKQGASGGFVPNYAPIDPVTFAAITNLAQQETSRQGLDATKRTRDAARASISLAGAVQPLSQEMLRAREAFGQTAVAAREAAVRTKALRGNLVNLADKNFARELFRSESARSLRSDPVLGGLASSLIGKGGKLDENALRQRMVVAQATGDKQTLNQLKNLNKIIEKDAQSRLNTPKTLGTTVAKEFNKSLKADAMRDRFSGTKGFSKSELRRELSGAFLASRGASTEGMTKGETNKALSAFLKSGGSEAQKAFSRFAQETGVRSSVSSLAKGGLMSGELRGLTGARSATGFIGAMNSLEKTLKSGGSAKDIRAAQRLAISEAAKAADPRNVQAFPALAGAVNNLVDEQKRQNREKSKDDRQQRRLQSSQRLAAQGGRFNLFRSQFQAGRAGQGSGLGGLLGRGASGASAGLRQFAGSLRGFGGNVGLTASFALPMLAGFVGSKRPREDRASFEGGQFRITEGAAGERASSTLMGAGIGALFGLPGMLIGAAAGFSTSASKMSLSIEEIVKMQEKQIAAGNANIQATTNLSNLNKDRARAFATGNLDAVNQIDTAINQAISQITDPEILGKVLAVSGSPEGLSNIQKTLQGRLSQDVSTQNFALAIDRKNSKNAATSLANLVDQRLRSGEIQGGRETVNKTLNQIRDNLAKTRAAGTAIGEAELMEIRQAAAGRQGLTSSGTLAGAGTGALLAGTGLALASLAAAPFTGGGSLLGLKGASLLIGGGAVAGAVSGREIETERANKLLANLGEDPLKGADALARLRDASIITQGQFESLSAAFNAGTITFQDLADQLKSSLDAFDKVTKRQTVLGQQTFNLEKSFDRAIRALRKSSEIENIREGGRIKRQGSILDFTSRFSASTPQNRLNQSQRRLNLFNQGVGFRVRSFEDAQSAQLLTSTKQAGKTLSFTPNLTQGLIDTVRQGGGTALQSQIDSRKLSGKLDLFGGLDAKGREVLLNDLENLFKTNTKESLAELAGIIGTSDKGTIDNVRNLITDRQGILSGENVGTVSFQKEISEQSREILQDILDKQQDRRDILAAQIETDRKNAKLAEAQTIVQGRVNDLLSELSSRNNLQDSRERGFLGRQRASSQRRISGLSFEASDTFRGSRTNKEERTRQTQIQEKIFQEELKTRQQEEVSRLKSEARRLISEQKLVFALNNLSKNIDETVRKIVDDPSGSTTTIGPGLPGSKSPSGLNGLAAGLSSAEQKKVDSLNDQIKKEREQSSTLRRDITRARNNKELAAVGGRLKGINTQRQSTTGTTQVFDGMEITTKQTTRLENNKELATRLSREISAAIAPKIVNGMSAGMSDSEKAISKTLLTMEGNDLQKVEKLRAIIENAVDTTKTTIEQYDKEIKAKDEKLDQLSSSIEEKVKEIQTTRNKVSSTTTSTPKVLEKLKDMGNITINTTNDAIKAINELGLDASDLEKLKSRISDLAQQKGITDESRNLLDTLMSEIYNSGEAIQDFIKSQNLKLFQDKFVEFTKSLQFMDESMGTFRGLRELNSLDIRQRAASNTLSNVLEQDNREAQFQTLMQDPSATNAQRAAAKVAARSQTIGTQTQRDQLVEFQKQADAARQEAARVIRDTSITDEERNRLTRIQSEKLTTLNRSMVDLTLQMQRTTARDGGVTQEIPANLGAGLEQGFADLEYESEQIYTRLGRDLPFAFRDGMVDAMQAALNGADNLRDRLKDIGVSFLQMIQKAFLQSAANRITGSLGGLFDLELNSGGMVRGGSGVRDDVPALLTGGEYVIRKSAVQKYGTGMLSRINQGAMPAFAKGGAVDMNIAAPKAAEREAYYDKNEYGNVKRYKTLSKEIGIDSRLTGFARANDRKILEFFGEQQKQFREDLATKEQEKARKEAKAEAKKARRNAILGAVAGIAGGVLIGKAMDWYKGTDFAKNRAAKKEAKAFNKKLEKSGKYDYTKGRASYQQSGAERAGIRRDIDYFQGQGWQANEMSQYLRTQDVQHRITGNQTDYKVSFNKGGQVPAMLTGGEYVMSPEAVKTYGSQMMGSINNGTFSGGNQASGGSVSNNVKISINVDNQGGVSQTSSNLDTKEFASKVKAAVMDVIQKEKRVGGSLR